MSQGKEIVVGVVIILALAVVAGGTLFLKGSRFGSEIRQIDVLARDVGQLMEGNDVKFRGVDVGTVRSIAVEPGGDAVRLQLDVERDLALNDSMAVVIAPESMFGDWQAEIVARSRYPRFDYFPVEQGATNPAGERVLGAYALPDISMLTAAADEISENLAALTARVDRAFTEETAENLRLAISNIQQVSEDIKDMIEQQASTFENVTAEVERTATEISGAAVTARSTLERADRLLASAEVDSILVNLDQASRGVAQISSQVGGATEDLEATLARVDSTFRSLEQMTAAVARGEGTLGMLLNDSTLYVRARATMTQLDSLLVDLRENPRRYINLSIF